MFAKGGFIPRRFTKRSWLGLKKEVPFIQGVLGGPPKFFHGL